MNVTPTRRRVLPAAIGLALLAISQASHAITFEQLNASGTGSGVFYTPSLGDWVMAPASSDSSIIPTSGGWLLSLGQSSFGASESGSQISDIYGAGLVLPGSTHGWRVDFSANLRTWDSYNDGSVVSPNPGGSLGFWDLFSVNMNQSGFYWNLVSASASSGDGTVATGGNGEVMPSLLAVGGDGLLIDPLLPVHPAGSVVTNTNLSDPNYLPGSTWAWGGRDYAAGYFESLQTNGSVLNTAGGATYVSFVLDTRTSPANDRNFPSWGQFGTAGVFANVPNGVAEGGGDGSPGTSPSNPVLPISVTEGGSYNFNKLTIGESGLGIDDYLYIDPEVAVGYQYGIVGGSGVSFAEVSLPTLNDATGYSIEILINGVWTKVADVADGGTYNFDSNGPTVFRITGIDPSLGLDPANYAAFVTGLKFNQPGEIDLSMTPITQAVPEPSTYAMMLAGLAMVLTTRRRKG